MYLREGVCSKTGVQQDRCAARQVCSKTGGPALLASGGRGRGGAVHAARQPRLPRQLWLSSLPLMLQQYYSRVMLCFRVPGFLLAAKGVLCKCSVRCAQQMSCGQGPRVFLHDTWAVKSAPADHMLDASTCIPSPPGHHVISRAGAHGRSAGGSLKYRLQRHRFRCPCVLLRRELRAGCKCWTHPLPDTRCCAAPLSPPPAGQAPTHHRNAHTIASNGWPAGSGSQHNGTVKGKGGQTIDGGGVAMPSMRMNGIPWRCNRDTGEVVVWTRRGGPAGRAPYHTFSHGGPDQRRSGGRPLAQDPGGNHAALLVARSTSTHKETGGRGHAEPAPGCVVQCCCAQPGWPPAWVVQHWGGGCCQRQRARVTAAAWRRCRASRPAPPAAR
jgi:hypothetical protein